MIMNKTHHDYKNTILRFHPNKERPTSNALSAEIMKHRKESCSTDIKNQWLFPTPAINKQEYEARIRTERDVKNTRYECNLSSALKNFERNLSKYFKPNENFSGISNEGRENAG